jgi:ribose 5-phosphate isomerase B
MKKGNSLFIASDHAGFLFKKSLCDFIKKEFREFSLEDLGPFDDKSVDYPVFAEKLARQVVDKEAQGILICGSGIGMSISANKIPGVRAALVWDTTSARLSRAHNSSNIVCLGARLLGEEVAKDILRTWLTTPYEGGERHDRRLSLIKKLETAVFARSEATKQSPSSDKTHK